MTAPDRQLSLRREGRVAFASIDGEVDLANASSLGEAIAEGIGNDAMGLVLDLTKLGYLDSAGVRMILTLASRCRRSRQRIRIVAPEGSRARRILTLAGVERLVSLDEGVDEAEAAIADMPN
jgi:anti-anti-sigma factor